MNDSYIANNEKSRYLSTLIDSDLVVLSGARSPERKALLPCFRGPTASSTNFCAIIELHICQEEPHSLVSPNQLDKH